MNKFGFAVTAYAETKRGTILPLGRQLAIPLHLRSGLGLLTLGHSTDQVQLCTQSLASAEEQEVVLGQLLELASGLNEGDITLRFTASRSPGSPTAGGSTWQTPLRLVKLEALRDSSEGDLRAGCGSEPSRFPRFHVHAARFPGRRILGRAQARAAGLECGAR